MPITLKRTVVKIGNSLRLTVPPEVAEILRIKAGDEVEYSSDNGNIFIQKAKR